MASLLRDFKCLTFDCYGTLIDWETGIWDALQPLVLANRRDDVERRRGLAAFARLESAQQAVVPGMPYPEVLTRVHAALAVELAMTSSPAMDECFGQSVPQWPAFPDSADALRTLARHYRLVILSNVDRNGFAASNRKLGVEFDAIYTAEDIGSYKPRSENFSYLLHHLEADHGIGREAILHTAQSLFHDHAPARAAGLANVWIDRQRLSAGGDWGATAALAQRPATDFLYFTLAEMAQAVVAESE